MKNFQIPSKYSKIENEDSIIKLIEKHARPASEVILDDVDLRNLLKVSRRTSLEYRKKVFLNSINWIIRFFTSLKTLLQGLRNIINNMKIWRMSELMSLC